jgi:high-affinity iron transporter
MGAAFLITLRDGVEAMLVVAIVMAYLRQLGRMDRFFPVLGGALVGAGLSASIGFGLYKAIGELEGRNEQIVEAITAFASAAVLTWMIFWMRSQARTIGGELRGRVDRAIASGAVFGLASIAFIGVLREGIEMSLFMLNVILVSGAKDAMFGAVAGLGVALLIGCGVYQGGQFINLRVFFKITGGLIILFAAGLLGKGVFELQVLGTFNSAHYPLWDLESNAIIGHGQFAAFMKGIFGWSSRPSIEQVVVWVAYVTTAGWLFYFGQLPRSLAVRIDNVRNSIASVLAAPANSQVAAELDRPES